MSHTIEQFGEYITKTWHDEESYFMVKLTDSSRQTLDVYYDVVNNLYKSWDNTIPLYFIQDITDDKISLTPYFRSQIDNLNKQVEKYNINFYLAVVTQNNFTGQIMRMFGRLFANKQDGLNLAFFTDLQKAHDWIVEQKAKHN